MRLQNSKVVRGGVTSRYWTNEATNVNISATETVNVGTSIASKGGGTTGIEVRIGVEDFVALLRSMTSANRQAALSAMSSVLAAEVANQPEQDAAIRKASRTEVVDAALDAYLKAPVGADEHESAVHTAVSSIVRRLNAQGTPKSN